MNLEVTGPKILFKIPIFGGIPITETIVNTWIVMALIVGLRCTRAPGARWWPNIW